VSSTSIPAIGVGSASREPAGASSIERTLGSAATLNVLVTVALALRVWAYAARVSLSLDELLLSRNILGLSLGDLLTKPLQLDQVAPRGFLLAEKLAVLAFGRNEYALRLFPFLCSLASVVLFRRVATRTLQGLAVPFAMALFALAIPVIQYGVEVKQYIVDATAAILLLDIALSLCDPATTTRRLVLFGLAGWILIWFSQASVVVMGGIGLGLAVRWLMNRDRLTARALLVTIPLWATASLVAVVAGMRSMTPATRAFMDDFWHIGFLPVPFSVASAVRWIWDQTLSVYTDPTLLRYPWSAPFVAVALLGMATLWTRRRDVALFLLGPFVVALIAAGAHQYPFRGRLMFYLVPGLLLTLAAGAEWLRGLLGRVYPALGGAAMAALLVPPAVALAHDRPPYEIEHHRAVFAYLQQKRQPGDVVYVFPLTRVGALYYGPRYGLRSGDWATAICDRTATRPYVRDVDRYRGTPRLWLLTSGVAPFRVARAAVRSYLGTIGVKRDSLVLPSLTMGSVSLELFDLTDSTRLGKAVAESFPVPPMPTDPKPGCRPWAHPSPLDSLQ
jgi:hypothetical protein